jgi:hypothetical protein
MARPPRQSGRKVTFTPEAAQRIARAVVTVEKGDRSIAAAGRQSAAGDDGGIVRGTFTGTWAKGTTITVTDATLSSVTYTAKNYFANVGSTAATSAQQCMIAYAGGEWVLVSAQPTAVTIISHVSIVGTALRFATAQVNVMGPGFGNSHIDVGLESC